VSGNLTGNKVVVDLKGTTRIARRVTPGRLGTMGYECAQNAGCVPLPNGLPRWSSWREDHSWSVGERFLKNVSWPVALVALHVGVWYIFGGFSGGFSGKLTPLIFGINGVNRGIWLKPWVTVDPCVFSWEYSIFLARYPGLSRIES